MDWWLYFVAWVDGHQASVIILLTLSLVGATAFYAWRTHDILKATRRQADASVIMAQEMREQREAQYQPMLKLEPMLSLFPLDDAYADGLTTTGGSLFSTLKVSVVNVGMGAAIDISFVGTLPVSGSLVPIAAK